MSFRHRLNFFVSFSLFVHAWMNQKEKRQRSWTLKIFHNFGANKCLKGTVLPIWIEHLALTIEVHLKLPFKMIIIRWIQKTFLIFIIFISYQFFWLVWFLVSFYNHQLSSQPSGSSSSSRQTRIWILDTNSNVLIPLC